MRAERTVLMFSYWLPPCVRWPTATLRVTGLARHLPRHGWHPVVVAPDLTAGLCSCEGCTAGVEVSAPTDDLEVVRLSVSPRLGVRLARTVSPDTTRQPSRAAAGWRSRSLAPLATYFEVKTDWVKHAQNEGKQLASEYEAQVVWTTSPPFQSVRIGSFLKLQLGVPWIADLRDEISRVRGHAGFAARTAMWARMPLRSHLRNADHVAGINRDLADLDAAWLGRSVDTVPSGFDAESWDVPAEDVDPHTFVISYAGRFYPGHIDPTPALAGLRRFLDGLRPQDRSIVRLVYYGEDGDFLQERADQFGVADILDDRGFLHGSAFRGALRSADVLLTLTSLDDDSGIPGGKLYDYLGAGRPILAVPSGDTYVDDLLETTAAGTSASTPDEIALTLRGWFDRWKQDGRLPWVPRTEAVEQYTIATSAQRLASLLDAACRRTSR